MSGEADALALLRQALDDAAEAGRTRDFWWRDDDAVDTGPRLDRLLHLAQRAGAPVALAVIPASATDRLLAACAGKNVRILQHGIRHENAEPSGRKAELGPARSPEALVAACVEARARLAASPAFLPVMVPPWNRMREDLPHALGAAGYRGISLFAGPPRAGPPRRVDTHVDPVAWRGDRCLLDARPLARMMESALAERGPVGLLTHHAVHTAAVDAFVERMVGLVADHPGGRWLDAAGVFEGDAWTR